MKKDFNITMSRRSTLKGIVSVVTAASLSGCSSGDDDDSVKVVTPQENLVYDKELKIASSSGPYNCGAKCQHKIYHKNGRIYNFSSAGDIPREGSYEKDNSSGKIGMPIQRRACVRGYIYIQRLYQPDRLKYPMIQTKEKGNMDGFKRVSWNYAIEETAKAIDKAIKRKAELGYSPIMCKWIKGINTFASLVADPIAAPCITHLGNESTGAADAAKFDTVGPDALTNATPDRLNSRFIITWGLDPTRTTYYVEHAHWFNTVAKEDGIPLVVISPNHSDAAAILSTGVPGYVYTRADGTNETYDIPGWVPVRPATDAALAAAMAYVIYKNDIYDHDMVDDPSKVFGFYETITAGITLNSGDTLGVPVKIDANVTQTPVLTYSYGELLHAGTVLSASLTFTNTVTCVSTAPTSATTTHKFLSAKNRYSPNNFTDDAGNSFSKGDPFVGAEFIVPKNNSFTAYLNSLEVEWAGAPGMAPVNGQFTQPASYNQVGSIAYDGVLEYAAALTGVPAGLIEALAFKYATADPAFLDVGGGPQRAWNGVEWVQMMIALTSMTGNIDKAGGGAGFAMMSHADLHLVRGDGKGVFSPSMMLENVITECGIYVPMNEWNHVILTGKDHRAAQKFADDIELTTQGKIRASDLMARFGAGKKMVEVDVWFMNNYNGLTTIENINKTVTAMKEIETVICCDQTMTPTASHSDILLPVVSHYETEKVLMPTGNSGLYKMDAVISKQYDTKTDNEIRNLILEKLNEMGYNFQTMYSNDWTPEVNALVAAGTYAALSPASPLYKQQIDDSEPPSYEQFCKDGAHEWPIPKGSDITPFKYVCIPGGLQTTTGRINFWQPLWGKIRPKTPNTDPTGTGYDGFRNPTAAYQPLLQGYEEFYSGNDPLRGGFTGYTSPSGNDGSGRTYKLYYMTNKSRNRAHTVFDNVAMIKDQFIQVVHINTYDADERGIKDGDIVYVFNDRGCTKLPAKVSQYVAPGVISIEHGAWYRPHPYEQVWVWQDTGIDSNGNPVFKKIRMPVDIGGAENMLTMSRGTSEGMVGQAISAQGGPCEVSLRHPDVLLP